MVNEWSNNSQNNDESNKTTQVTIEEKTTQRKWNITNPCCVGNVKQGENIIYCPIGNIFSIPLSDFLVVTAEDAPMDNA